MVVQPSEQGLRLEPVLDLGAAERLHSRFAALRGGPLEIDASQVERLGGLCLQVLLSVRKTWAADGHGVSLSCSSPAFEDAWALFGAPAFAPSPTPDLHQGSPA